MGQLAQAVKRGSAGAQDPVEGMPHDRLARSAAQPGDAFGEAQQGGMRITQRGRAARRQRDVFLGPSSTHGFRIAQVGPEVVCSL